MKFKATALLITSLLALAGCDQAENSARQLMGKAAENARQVVDDTHKAAEQALSEAVGAVTGKKESAGKGLDQTESSSREI